MKAAYGEEKAREIMIDGTPHVMIFPNLFIAEIQMFVIQPLAVDESVQHVTALQFKGAPDLNRRLRQQTMGSVGPAGFLLADDSEMYERTPVAACRCAIPNGCSSAAASTASAATRTVSWSATSPTRCPSRGIWRHYRALMEAA